MEAFVTMMGGCHRHLVDMGRNVRCSAEVRTVYTTRDYLTWLSNKLDVHVCENLIHNYQGWASNFILYINTKVGLFCFLLLALTHIEFLRSARLDEHGKFCSELYWGLFTILENNITNGNASHSSWVAFKTHVNLCAFVHIESMVILHIGADIQLLIRSYSCSCVHFFFFSGIDVLIILL